MKWRSSFAADPDLDSANQTASAIGEGELIGRLTRRRAEAGLSQARVAGLMQTSQSAVARLESGRHGAQFSTVARYARALGLSLDLVEDEWEQTGGSGADLGDEGAGASSGGRASAEPRPSGRKPEDNGPPVTPETPGGPDPNHVLTWRQRKVLQVIREWVQEHGYPPSMREIGDAVGLTSRSAVSHQLRTLERKGYLHRDAGRPRAIEVRQPGRDESEPTGIPGIDVPAAEATYVPVAGQVTAGAPVPSSVPLPRELVGEGSLVLLQVAGDSMIGAAIADGDWVVVREQLPTRDDALRDGDLAAVNIDGAPAVRTYKQSDGHVWLIPHHPAYTPVPGDKVSILGRVVAILRRILADSPTVAAGFPIRATSAGRVPRPRPAGPTSCTFSPRAPARAA